MKILIFFCILGGAMALVSLSGCLPLAADATIAWGANQRVQKTLDIDQKQTAAQTQQGVEIVEEIVDVVPYVLRVEPAPTPTPKSVQKVKVKKRVIRRAAKQEPSPCTKSWCEKVWGSEQEAVVEATPMPTASIFSNY